MTKNLYHRLARSVAMSIGMQAASRSIVAFDRSEADPGFLDRGFKFRKGGSLSKFCLIFSKIPHENEII